MQPPVFPQAGQRCPVLANHPSILNRSHPHKTQPYLPHFHTANTLHSALVAQGICSSYLVSLYSQNLAPGHSGRQEPGLTPKQAWMRNLPQPTRSHPGIPGWKLLAGVSRGGTPNLLAGVVDLSKFCMGKSLKT